MSSTREPRWWRRPRRPLPDLLWNWGFIAGLAVWGLIGFIGAPLVVISPTSSDGQRLGFGGFAIVTVLVAVAALVHIRRPATILPDYSVDGTQVESWARELRRHGVVEIGIHRQRMRRLIAGFVAVFLPLSVWAVVGGDLEMRTVTGGTFVLFLILLSPQVELVMGGGPALRVDQAGVTLGRSRALLLPWDHLVEVTSNDEARFAYRSYAVLVLTQESYAIHRRRSRLPTRLADAQWQWWHPRAFIIPSTVDAACQDLAAWLEQERVERSRPRPADPDGAAQTD